MFIEQKEELKKFNFFCKEIDDIYHEMAVRCNLADGAFNVLYFLVYQGGSCLQKEITGWSCMSRKTVHSAVKKLEAQGYIRTETTEWKREKQVFLTPFGESFVEKYFIPIFQTENQIFQSMPPEECHELLRLTEKLVALYKQNFQEMKKNQTEPRKENI